MRVLVRGAGVAGLAVAHELAVGGAEVTLVEREPAPGGGASWYAGGMLAPFCERESAEPAVLVLGRNAARWWQAALPGLVRFEGTLVVAPPRDSGELARFAARTEGARRLDAAAVAALEPDLAGRFRSGLFFGQEAHLDPRRALLRLHARLVTLGVRCHFGRTAPPPGQRFERTVDCTGMAAGRPGLRGVRGEMLYLETGEIALSRPVRLIHPRFPVYVVPRGAGRFMVGATMIESAAEGPVSARSMMELLNAAYALHPAFGEARVVEASSGVRPAYADNLPRIEAEGDRLFVNGFHRHGFLLAPALAARAARLVLSHDAEPENSDETDRQRQGARVGSDDARSAAGRAEVPRQLLRDSGQ
ncbi:glycine oxidase [Tistlia consotensis]|uniref:Glycine oxidase n=1 Tax=Tistlia consotensis USBA 355 TaxID=560819 RepID=A0A1Y6BQW5_9PROT|nr:glycine oxidase ThiO [Tistlia consotensis]SMF20874.1 glycine oxidase [Tistlia consotensis USBA 355]SNR47449.1 glycine oxidase [Tistlia consotensis]